MLHLQMNRTGGGMGNTMHGPVCVLPRYGLLANAASIGKIAGIAVLALVGFCITGAAAEAKGMQSGI